jgi:tRNA threonylcarbamoyladenosine biosynthesis protein TsaB
LQTRFGDKLSGTDTESLPAAEFMLLLAVASWQAGRAAAPEEAQPVYLRNKIALTTKERMTAQQ